MKNSSPKFQTKLIFKQLDAVRTTVFHIHIQTELCHYHLNWFNNIGKAIGFLIVPAALVPNNK